MSKKIALFTTENTSYIKEKGKVSFSAPSNIALVKYWGKHGVQLPQNASLSFTLSNCKTITTISYVRKEKKSNDFDFQFLFEGNPKPSFEPKINTFFERIYEYCPFLKDFSFVIDSQNTFPHSSGIASSASGMAAMAQCLVTIEKELGSELNEEQLIQKASFLARLGSGSACRSLEGPVTVWGAHENIGGSSDQYAVKVPFEIHEVFKNYQDTVLLVDKGEKQVSSTVGHNLMHGHPFAKQRFQQANDNLTELAEVMQSGDMDRFIHIVESEALTLHSMMMTSSPYFILMKPETLEVINHIWQFRRESNIPVCFTLDAGANVHVLYPESFKEDVLSFINNQLVRYCQNKQYICDVIGTGVQSL